MYSLNYKFFDRNILRGILIKKYGVKNSLSLPSVNRIIVSLELKDKEDNIAFENFTALNILTYITKLKSSCVSHTMRYKFGQKHTFIFQSILRSRHLENFLTFFCLNSLLLLKKKQIDLMLYYNLNHLNILLGVKDVSFFSQLPAEYFKWDTGLKMEFSVLNSELKGLYLMDLMPFIKGLDVNLKKKLLVKNLFYYEIFSYKG